MYIKDYFRKKSKLINLCLIIIAILLILLACTNKDDYNNSTNNISPKGTSSGDIKLKDNIETKNNSLDNNDSMDNDGSVDASSMAMDGIHVFIDPNGKTLDTRISVPKGYTRVSPTSDEITDFIRTIPLKDDGSQVLKYDGDPIYNQANHVAVFKMDIGDRDLQQCADSIMRVYGEYYWSLEKYDQIAFHLTNGFYMNYSKWREGYRIMVDGNNVSWTKSASYDDSYETFDKYMKMVFAYAGTLSLTTESTAISLDDLIPGDMLLEGGSPGHCVMIVDMAHDEDGNRCYLLAQGYMPAQDFHILINPLHPEDPWYYTSEMDYPIKTPSWIFDEGSLMRWMGNHSQ